MNDAPDSPVDSVGRVQVRHHATPGQAGQVHRRSRSLLVHDDDDDGGGGGGGGGATALRESFIERKIMFGRGALSGWLLSLSGQKILLMSSATETGGKRVKFCQLPYQCRQDV